MSPGDEVITPAVTFPTTLTPIVQNNLVPVFVDCKPGEYNIDPTKIEDVISKKQKMYFHTSYCRNTWRYGCNNEYCK